jgi:hypothetical protein
MSFVQKVTPGCQDKDNWRYSTRGVIKAAEFLQTRFPIDAKRAISQWNPGSPQEISYLEIL